MKFGNLGSLGVGIVVGMIGGNVVVIEDVLINFCFDI